MTPPTLASQLRAGTRSLHAQAERSGLMPALLRGRIGRHDYCRLLRNLHAIYAALEPALSRHSAHPGLAPIYSTALERRHALVADLELLQGRRWRDELSIETAAREYVQRLETLAEYAPGDLAAHAYVRYLGDLSGGQLLRGIVAAALRLDGDDGTRFYRFPEPGAEILAARFRDGLAAIPLDREDSAERLLTEAQLGFQLHASLFEQLASGTARPA